METETQNAEESSNIGWIELAQSQRDARKNSRINKLGSFTQGQTVIFRDMEWLILEISKDCFGEYNFILECVDYSDPVEKLNLDHMEKYVVAA